MNKYDSIINIKHFDPKNHTRMSIYERSAQFAPFAALTGFDEEIKETSRLTEKELFLDNEKIIEINDKLKNAFNNKLKIEIEYFLKAKTKDGGSYFIKKGIIKKIDPINDSVTFLDKTIIKLSNISDIK